MKKIDTKQLIIALLIGAVIALAVFFGQGAFSPERAETFMHLCYACFVPGVRLISAGLLVYASSGGAFDILRYGLSRVTVYFWSRKAREEMPKSYYDYVTAQREKPQKPFGFLLLAGGVYLAAAVVFLILYNGAA